MTETSFSLTVNGMPVGDATTINLQPGQDLHMALALEISLDLVGIPVAAVGGGEEPAPEGVYDAILPALGQSNNVGQSNAEEGDVFPAGVDEIRLASETGGVVEVLVPSIQSLEGLSTPGWSYSGNDAVYNNRTGWWYKWVIDYLADHPGARVLIIPIGLGGVGFKDYQDSLNTWNPWSPLVQPNFKNAEGEGQQLVSFAQQMLAMGMALAKPDAEVHIGWWQGEADVNSGMTQAEYASYLTYFVNLLRAVPGANKATFTTFGIFGPDDPDPTFETINAADRKSTPR